MYSNREVMIMQSTSSNNPIYKIPIRISKKVQIDTSDNILVVGAPKQVSAEKILIPNLLSGTDSYLVIDPDGIIRNKTKDTMEKMGFEQPHPTGVGWGFYGPKPAKS